MPEGADRLVIIAKGPALLLRDDPQSLPHGPG